jgi:hypothetical protein
MLPADCGLKVVMLVEGPLIGLLRARVTANLQFDDVLDHSQGQFPPLALLVVLVLPPAEAEDLLTWFHDLGLGQEEVAPILVDLAVVIEEGKLAERVVRTANTAAAGAAAGGSEGSSTTTATTAAAATTSSSSSSVVGLQVEDMFTALKPSATAAAAQLLPFLAAQGKVACCNMVAGHLLQMMKASREMAQAVDEIASAAALGVEGRAAGAVAEGAQGRVATGAATTGPQEKGAATAAVHRTTLNPSLNPPASDDMAIFSPGMNWLNLLKLCWQGFRSTPGLEREYTQYKSGRYQKVDVLVEVYRVVQMLWVANTHARLLQLQQDQQGLMGTWQLLPEWNLFGKWVKGELGGGEGGARDSVIYSN